MEDIAPGLVDAVTEEFHRAYDSSSKIQSLLEKVKKGTATYAEAQEYSLEVSKLIGQAYEKYVSSATLPDGRMYYNIASRLIPASMDENYALVSNYALEVQKKLNEQSKIGLKAQPAEKNQDRIDGLVDLASNAEKYDEISNQLISAFENYSLNIVDEMIKANASAQHRAGMHPKIIRKAERKCCEWCSALAGEYDYPDVPDDVYRRHANCRCLVTYDPADGKRKIQNVHTKKWTDAEDYGKLEARKKIGINSLISDLAQHPKRLASFTPAKLLAALEAEGFEIKPLMLGSLRGIPFEQGGGFKVNFEDGGLFQYHPEKGSHHDGAYYKISTGKGGVKHYDTEGNEIPNKGAK